MSRFIGALGLGALLLTMAGYNVGLFLWDVARDAMTGETGLAHVSTFYNDLFTVMIFTDVLVLILSIVVSGHYEFVFRSAALNVELAAATRSIAACKPFATPSKSAFIGPVSSFACSAK